MNIIDYIACVGIFSIGLFGALFGTLYCHLSVKTRKLQKQSQKLKK